MLHGISNLLEVANKATVARKVYVKSLATTGTIRVARRHAKRGGVALLKRAHVHAPWSSRALRVGAVRQRPCAAADGLVTAHGRHQLRRPVAKAARRWVGRGDPRLLKNCYPECGKVGLDDLSLTPWQGPISFIRWR